MKKKKNLIKMSVITGLLLTGSSVLGGSINVMAANPANYKDMTEYSSYESIINYESIKAENSSPYTDVSVALYDIDQDGTKELLISFGESDADWINYVYTLQNGTPQSIGSFYSPVLLYVADDNKGIYSVYGHMGYQKVDRITKQDEQMLIETVMEGDGGSGDYYSNEAPMIQSSFPEYGTSQDNGGLNRMPNYTFDFS